MSHFFRYQMARSPEGRIVLAGSAVLLLLAIVLFATPTLPGLPEPRVDKAITIFVLWPVIGFVYYVKACGPDYRSSMFRQLQMAVLMCAPVILALA